MQEPTGGARAEERRHEPPWRSWLPDLLMSVLVMIVVPISAAVAYAAQQTFRAHTTEGVGWSEPSFASLCVTVGCYAAPVVLVLVAMQRIASPAATLSSIQIALLGGSLVMIAAMV